MLKLPQEYYIKKPTAWTLQEASEKTLVAYKDLYCSCSAKLQACPVYYETKLCVHNFTMYNMISNYALNYSLHEVIAGLSVNKFALRIMHYLDTIPFVKEFL